MSLQVELVDYGMNSVSQGIDAMAITRVVIRPVLSCSGVTPQVRTLYIVAMYVCMHAVFPVKPQLPCSAVMCCACGLLPHLEEHTSQLACFQL